MRRPAEVRDAFLASPALGTPEPGLEGHEATAAKLTVAALIGLSVEDRTAKATPHPGSPQPTRDKRQRQEGVQGQPGGLNDQRWNRTQETLPAHCLNPQTVCTGEGHSVLVRTVLAKVHQARHVVIQQPFALPFSSVYQMSFPSRAITVRIFDPLCMGLDTTSPGWGSSRGLRIVVT